MNERRRLHAGLRECALSMAVVLLAACGGGGGGGTVRSTPPPAGGGGLGFTPTVANDASLTQLNPPTVAAQSPSLTFDAQLGRQLQVINAGASLAAGARGAGVGIGILDSGVRRNHPELTPRVVYNGFYLDSPPNNPNVDYVLEHGTWVALTAAGSAAGRWPGGVAPAATIVSGRFLEDTPPTDDGSGQGNGIGTTDAAGFAQFLDAAHKDLYAHGARIINNSWGGVYFEDESAGAAAIAAGYTDFILGKNGLIVFANGNYGDDPRYQADPSDISSLPTLAPGAGLERGWLTVAALDPDNPTQLLDFSQYCGRAMNYCLSAPGKVAVVGASPPDGNDQTTDDDKAYFVYGTSFSAPLVSGAAAAVWSAFPYFSNDQVRQTILGSARDVGAAGVDPVFGWGVLDVGKAANGPSNFSWGDFSVSFSGNSVWRNSIVGDGGLIKAGSGTLTLTEAATYAGATRVDAGGLDVRKGLKSDLSVASGATVWASGAFGGNVANNGRFFNGASAPASIAGNFTQSATGNFGVWLGSKLSVSGMASLGGQASILGVKSGYTTVAKETLLTANGGVNGTFSSLKAAPNVFLDASLSYDPNNVFLNINRIDVSTAVAGMGLSSVTQASSVRVEGAMQAIDGQLASGGGTIGTGFIDDAGALQRVTSVAQADRTIRSLSGELHAAADAASLDNLEASRRALSARFGELAGQSQSQGNWYRPLGQPGQGGSAFGQFQNDGWLMGSDQRFGANTVAGFAFGTTDADGFLGTGYDRSHERQTQARFYLGTTRGNAYALGQLATGRYERQLRRALLLGDRTDGVATDYAGNFTTANLETGYRFGSMDKSLAPYAGVDYVRLDRDGFVENGAAGFGLKTNGSVAERTLAVAGLRAERAWTTGSGIELVLRGYAEWQRALSESGLLAQASFVGADSWSPLYGEGFSRSSGLLGLGFDAALSRRTMLSFGYDQRFGSIFGDRQWSAKLRYGF